MEFCQLHSYQCILYQHQSHKKLSSEFLFTCTLYDLLHISHPLSVFHTFLQQVNCFLNKQYYKFGFILIRYLYFKITQRICRPNCSFITLDNSITSFNCYFFFNLIASFSIVSLASFGNKPDPSRNLTIFHDIFDFLN